MRLRAVWSVGNGWPMIAPPETIKINHPSVACDGSGEVDSVLGHPRVFLKVDPETGFVECGYCDRRFVLKGGPADRARA